MSLPVLIEKSRIYTKRIAKHMVVTLTPFEAASAPKRPRNPPTISLAQAKPIKESIVALAPTNMKGFLFPHDILQLSLMMPIYGWTSVPERGPAIHTRARRDLFMPSERRYGYFRIHQLGPQNVDLCDDLQSHWKARLTMQSAALITKSQPSSPAQEPPKGKIVKSESLTLLC